MKTKAFLLIMMMVFTASFASAQHRERRLHLGLHVEPHVDWMKADEAALQNGPVRIGFGTGARIDFHFQPAFALSFGCNWNITGGNILYSDAVYLNLDERISIVQPGTRITYRLRYVEVPVALKILLPEIGYSTWFFEAGIDPMYNTRALINATDNNIQDEPFRQGIIPMNLAWHSGVGMKYALGRNVALQVSLMYKNTFLDVTRESAIRTPDNIRLNQVGLNIGFVF